MARMVCGDVGSGKTAVAAAAVYFVVRGGGQVLLMAPTEILANQHYNDLSPLFAKLGISVALLTGSQSPSKKRSVRAALSAGTVDLVIGTHALLTEGVHAARCGLVITDEQHRFGVGQRAALSSANSGEADPHVLVMSATPIPRTLSLILYGDLEVSTLDELPPGRQKVDTFVVSEAYRDRLNAFIRKQVETGGQVYVVCPAVETQDSCEEDELDQGGEIISLGEFSEIPREAKPPLRSAVNFSREMQQVFPDLSVAYLHGKMKAAEKDRIMCAFAKGTIQILVSTTVIEVGVNVPNASLMIVENAERFGLSQLHQLRGRVGRGQKKSYCVLVSDCESENAKKRLAVMRATSDGYKIAEKDLELRGPGDFFPASSGSARQSGDFRLGIASLCTDLAQLKEAFAEAKKTVSADPLLEKPENRPAREAMESLFSLNNDAMN